MSEELRVAFREGQQLAVAGPACPAAEKIFEAVRGSLEPIETLALVEHSIGCGHCSLAFRLAREIVAEVEPVPLQLAARRFKPWTAVALTGAIAAAAAVVLIPRGAGDPNVPVYRAGGAEIASLLKDDALPRDHFLLRWSPLASGTRYSVNVATPDLKVMFTRGGIAESELLVPASALAQLPAGSKVVWRVTALLADGKRIESTAFINAVR